MKILNIYRDFKNFEPTFDKWKQEQDLEEKRAEVVLSQKPVTPEVLREQKRAKILVDTLTSLDEYAQTKAEDIDSVSQTVLYVAVGTLGTVGTLLGKFLSKALPHNKLSKVLPSAMGVGFALATFLPVVRSTVFNQVRANRIARFDGIHSDKLFHLNNFAVLTDEQQKQVDNEVKNTPDSVLNKKSIINRVNLLNSLSVFKEFTMKQGEFAYLKNQHDKKIAEDNEKLKTVQFTNEEINQSQKDRELFSKVLKKVDMEAQYSLERIEKAVNVGYSSLFAGGVLEYLVSDGVLNLFNVKHKIIRPVLAWGLPIVTVMSLNKTLANFLNDAIKAVRYKKMQEFLNDTNNFKEYDKKELENVSPSQKNEEKQGFFAFFKGVFKDIEDYQNYQKTKRIQEKKAALVTSKLALTQKQKDEAELFRRNTQLTINALDDQTQKYASALETMTESTTIPMGIVAPILGTIAADKLHKKLVPNGGMGLLFKAFGAILAFLPAALGEIYFVQQQRRAKRCAILIAKNNLQDSKQFLDPSKKENQIKMALTDWHFTANKSEPFATFKKNFSFKS